MTDPQPPKDTGGDSADPKEEVKEEPKMVSYGQLYRYATFTDKFIMFWALIAAAGCGVSQPLMMAIFGDMTGESLKSVLGLL